MRRTIMTLLGLLLIGSLGVTRAEAALPILNVDCEDDVTSSGRLDGDITDCDGTPYGLRINTSGITLDLGGFSIVGDGVDDGGGFPGIQIAPGVNRVTIRNGSISGFDEGISGGDTSRSTVADIFVHNIAVNRGIELLDSDFRPGRNTVRDSFVDGDGTTTIGVALDGDFSKILRTTVHDAEQDGFEVRGENALIKSNTAFANGSRGFNLNVSDSRLIGNRAVENQDDGFEIDYEDTLLVERNDALRNGMFGFELDPDEDEAVIKIRDNIAHGNADIGFSIESPDNVKASRNYAYGDGSACSGLLVGDLCNSESELPPLEDELGSPIECGAEVTTSGRLEDDIATCSGHGLVVNTPNITIDLDHRDILGDFNNDPGDFGIKLGPLAKNVKIRNGSVLGFDSNISPSADDGVFTTPGVKVTNVYIGDFVDSGIILEGNGVAVNRVVVDAGAGDDGIDLTGTRARITRSIVNDPDEDGMRLDGKESSATGNLVVSADSGAGILTDGTRNRVIGNTVLNAVTGINAGGTSPVVGGNDAHNNGSGIVVSLANGTIKLIGNDAHGNLPVGIEAIVVPPVRVRAQGNIALGFFGTPCQPSTIS